MKPKRFINLLITTFLFSILMALSFSCTAYAKDSVIRIKTIGDLYNVRNNMSAHYILLNDLDLTEASWPNTGEYSYGVNGWLPIGCNGSYQISEAFTGIFDGNGHTIKGIYVAIQHPDSLNSCYYLGFMGLNKGIIKNVRFEDMKIEYSKAHYNERDNEKAIMGAVCAVNAGTIKNCSVSGSITGSCGMRYGKNNDVVCGSAGGFSGKAESGAVFERCSNSSNINFGSGYYNKDYYSECKAVANVGGICGEAESDEIIIRYCSNYGNITRSNTQVFGSSDFKYGGILGDIHGSVDNCFNAGNVYGSQNPFGIGGGSVSNSYTVGDLYNTPDGLLAPYPMTSTKNVENCYYKSGTTGPFVKIDGSVAVSEELLSNENTYSGFDFLSIWEFDTESGYNYPVFRDEIDTIEIEPPNKTTYYTDDLLNLDGGYITVYYRTGKSEKIDLYEDYLSGYDMSAPGRQTVKVSYLGYEGSFQIVVAVRPELNQLNLISPPDKTEFARGTAFDFSGCQVEAVYANGATETIDVTAEMTTGGDITQSGDYIITFSYFGKSVTFPVKVVPVKMIGIEIKTMPTQTVYVPGEPFNKTGMVVEAFYNNDHREEVTAYSVEELPDSIGQHDVTVSYNGFTTTVPITVEDQKPVAIMVSKKPSKTQYVEGESFDPEGMIVTAVYNSGYSEPITEYSYSAIPEGTGKKSVTISYLNLSATVDVTVVSKQLLSIFIAETPDKITYVEGEEFDSSGMVVKGNFNNGKEEEITDYRITNINTTSIGKNKVYVSYGGFAASFDITVTEKELLNLSITEPKKLEYLLGEELDLTGLEVKANYSNGKTETVTDYVTEGSTETVGDNLIIITYKGKTTNFIITVHKPSDEWVIVEKPSCTVAGKKVQYCTHCNKILFEEIIPANGHQEVIIKGIQASCTEDGLTDGKKCSVCNEILEEQQIIPAAGHKEVIVKGKAATCTEDGLTDGKKCSVCEKVLEEQQIIPASDHKEVIVKGKAATCTEDGLTDGKKCSMCGKVLEEQQIIPASGHKDVIVKGKAATCTEDGLTDGKKCSVCGTILKKQDVIKATGHRIITISGKKATESATGLSEGKKCEICGKITVPQKVLPKLEVKGSDGTAVGEGASKTVAETAVKASLSDEGPNGTKFSLLQVQMKKVRKNSISIKWKGLPGARYIVYGNACGKGKKFEKIAEVSATSYTQNGLKKGTYYKYLVMAVKNDKVMSTSKTLHIATSGGKVGNNTKVTLSKKKLTLKKGKSKKLKATVKKGKLKIKKHRKVMWESSDPTVASVKSGKIKALKAGKAIIYAYAQNGKYAKCTVTVK